MGVEIGLSTLFSFGFVVGIGLGTFFVSIGSMGFGNSVELLFTESHADKAKIKNVATKKYLM